MQAKHALLLFALDGHEAHVGPLHRFADGRRVGRIVLAASAAEPVRGDELGRHEPHGMTQGLELPGPVMRTRARFHADQARRQRSNQLKQLLTRYPRAHQFGLAGLTDPMHSEYALGQIDLKDNNGHGLPLLRD